MRGRHLNALREVVVAASLDAPDVAVPWPLLARLQTLLNCDLVTFEGVDLERGHSYFSQVYGEDVQSFSCSIDATATESFWRLVQLSTPDKAWPSPTYAAEVTDPTDTVSGRQWCTLPVQVHAQAASRASTTSELLMSIPDGYGRQLRLLCFRYAGRDYNEREHFDLQLLLPHVEAAYRRGQQRRTARSLTTRQLALMELVRDGYTNTQIAHRLALAEGTVRTHLNNIYARLRVRSRTEAVSRVFGAGRHLEG